LFHAFTEAVYGIYLAALVWMVLTGVHRVKLLVYSMSKPTVTPPPEPQPWPAVTVQLPLYNEPNVVVRLLDAIDALDYPPGLLRIQILDDSEDETSALVDDWLARRGNQTHTCQLIRRAVRSGFKAGALSEGLLHTEDPIVGVFDADFVPPPNFLRDAVPWMRPGVGMVQARWGHINHQRNLLTRAQRVLLDGHFLVDQPARCARGRWFNFNGTAGIWRREAIEEAGGWAADTLTEDLDLSYRSQMEGWTFVYLEHLVAPAELPSGMVEFLGQQHRWAKGSVQTVRKIWPRVWRSNAAFATKLEAAFHLFANFGHPAIWLFLLTVPVVTYAKAMRWLETSAHEVWILPLAFGTFVGVYAVVTWWGSDEPRWRRLNVLPLVFLLGFRLAIPQTIAVVGGWMRDGGTFVRTPKAGVELVGAKPRVKGSRSAWEIGTGLYLLCWTPSVLTMGLWEAALPMGLWAASHWDRGWVMTRDRATPRQR